MRCVAKKGGGGGGGGDGGGDSSGGDCSPLAEFFPVFNSFVLII